MIFYRREFKDAIDFAVFPSLQGGPHNHQVRGYEPSAHQVAQNRHFSSTSCWGDMQDRSTDTPPALQSPSLKTRMLMT